MRWNTDPAARLRARIPVGAASGLLTLDIEWVLPPS
jgi:hypothetical protein